MGNSFGTYSYPQWNWGTVGSPFISFGSSSTTKKEETFEEYQKRMAKERAEHAKKQEENKKLLEEYGKKIKEAEEAKKENEKLISKAETGKVQEDGTIKSKETMADYKKLPWWKKASRAVSNMFTGTLRLATGFIGYETDPKTGESKWNPVKMVTNAGIALGCLALTAIPYVGPIIAAVLVASGVVAGGIDITKGIVKTVNAKTPEEIDQGWQDIGAGTVVGVASACGLRGLGKAAQASSATASASAASNTASTAARSGGIMSRIGGLFSKIGKGIKNFGKDATVNAYKATMQNAKASRFTYKRDLVDLSGARFKHLRAYGRSFDRTLPKLGKTKYENSKNTTNKAIDSRLAEINSRMTDIRGNAALKDEYALLEREQAFLTSQKSEITNTVTRNSFNNMRTNSKAHQEAAFWEEAAVKLENDGFVEFQLPGGRTHKITLNADKSNLKTLQDVSKRAQELAKQAEKLAKLRRQTMRKMAFRKDMKSEVELFTGKTRNSRIGRLWDTWKIQKSDITWSTPFKLAWDAMNITFKPWMWVEHSPTSAFYKMYDAIVPVHEKDILLEMFGEQLGMGDQTILVDVPVQNDKGEVVKQKTPLTKDLLTQLETAQKQYDEALAKLKEEERKLVA